MAVPHLVEFMGNQRQLAGGGRGQALHFLAQVLVALRGDTPVDGRSEAGQQQQGEAAPLEAQPAFQAQWISGCGWG